MNNNSVIINNYLQNEMSTAEKAAFEERLAKDKDLQHELYVQQQVINAVVDAGLKASFAKAIRHKIMVRRTVILGIAAGITAIMFFVYYSRQDTLPNNAPGETGIQQAANTGKPFVNPPLKSIDVPVSEYSFDAEKGDTIFYPSGSVIYFPPSALVDASGNPVKGMVKISYREFADPLDFFVSGIPMQYDSAGKNYTFESSGMCEINAFKDNKPVFVNQQAKPQVNLSVNNKSNAHNLYFLDTATRNWKFMGKDTITEVKNIASSKPQQGASVAMEKIEIPMKPVKPALASDDKQHFSIEIEPGSFQELFAYDKLKFEVLDESTYRRSDAEEQWESVKLDRTAEQGIYQVTFTNTRRKVSYKVRPVLEGEDYNAALKVFNEKNEAYQVALKYRLASEKIFSDSIQVITKDWEQKMKKMDEENEKINNLIEARNKKMKELSTLRKKRMEENAKALAIEQEISDLENKRIMQELSEIQKVQLKTDEIIRTFPVSRFGFWNCDQPLLQPDAIIITSFFTDSANKNIQFSHIGVVYKGLNAVNQYVEHNLIAVIPGRENMLWGINNGSFYYFTYDDFAVAGINRGTKSFKFRMHRSEKEISSYNDIRELVGRL